MNSTWTPRPPLSAITSSILTSSTEELSSKASKYYCDIVIAFCSTDVAENCRNIKVSECTEYCNVLGLKLFLFWVFLLSFLIIFSNIVVIWTIRKSRNEEKVKFHYMKTSLAIADIFNGINLAVVAIPNVFLTLGGTMEELDEKKYELDDQPLAMCGATIFLFFFASTMYQLALVSTLRFYGVMRPFQNKEITRKHILYLLIGTWIFALVVATSPLWFPHYFTLEYQKSTFLFMLGLKEHRNKKSFFIAVSLFIVFPYILMAVTTFATWFMVRKGLKQQFSVNSSGKVILKREHVLTRKIIFIEIGFALTTIPYFLNLTLINIGVLNCKTLTLPNLVTFYLFYSRSLVNILVYSVFEKSFKRSILRKLSTQLGFSMTAADVTSHHPTTYRH